MQPALPTLVRAWLPNRSVARQRGFHQRHADRRDVRPGADHSRWCCRSSVEAGGYDLLAGRCRGSCSRRCLHRRSRRATARCRDRTIDTAALVAGLDDPLIWLLGYRRSAPTTRCSSPPTPSYRITFNTGRGDMIGIDARLASTASQLIASFIMLAMTERLQRRSWPFTVFGPVTLSAYSASFSATASGSCCQPPSRVFGAP